MAALKTLTLRQLNVKPPLDLAVYTVNSTGVVEVKLLHGNAKFMAEQPMKIGVPGRDKKLRMPADGSEFLAALQEQGDRASYFEYV
jgi:hypothetical protein